jgi:hypothetical protein
VINFIHLSYAIFAACGDDILEFGKIIIERRSDRCVSLLFFWLLMLLVLFASNIFEVHDLYFEEEIGRFIN